MNKKWIIYFVGAIIISLIVECFVMQYYSYKGGNKDIKITPVSLKNAVYEDGKYITTDNGAEFEFEYNGFINEFSYNYKANDDFTWDLVTNETEIKEYVSADIINVANKKVIKNAQKVKLIINEKDAIVYDFTVHNKAGFSFRRFALILTTLLVFAYIFSNRKNLEDKLPKIFLITSIILGSLLIISTPLSAFTSEDDQVHFHNMYTLLDGDNTEWSRSSRYYDKLIIGAPFRFMTSEEQNEYVKFLNDNDDSNTSVTKPNISYGNIKYNNLVYLPEALVMKIAKNIKLPFIIVLLLGKFTNLFVYILFVYLAIKKVKHLKQLFFVVGLIPHAVNLACQFSYDPSLIAVGMYAVALFINMLYDENFDRKTLFKYYTSIIWICLPKAIYCPLLLLPIIAGRKKYKKRENIAIIIVSIVLFMLLLFTFVLPTILSPNVAGDVRMENTSVTEQLKFIMHNPINYLVIFTRYTMTNLYNYFLGGETLYNMGYIVKSGDIITNFIYSILLINFLYVIFTEKLNKNVFKYKNSIFIFCILFIVWGLVATALYLSWTSVGNPEILGVQGRYFFPLSILAFCLLIPKSGQDDTNGKSNSIKCIIPIGVLSFNIFYILCLFGW